MRELVVAELARAGARSLDLVLQQVEIREVQSDGTYRFMRCRAAFS
jgi:hypothetical protein